ncbi:hypothetical protein [Methylocaldum szegediense]|jgi:hypothetical protein|uniref:Uncharacterized protein n=1 Tax=Methylocaldum szegediense TaxID=73780 RepID=A0ABN8X155_9GAMM|nr:hypothetical protein [Methylocaldum szegediense]CAI8808254.1 protein of unknown function [Methylocaldum szegediense]
MEGRGDFLAGAPGQTRKLKHASTVAYLTRLLIHGYVMLAISDEDGFPVEEMGLVTYEDDTMVSLCACAVGAVETAPGECGNHAVILDDTCQSANNENGIKTASSSVRTRRSGGAPTPTLTAERFGALLKFDAKTIRERRE